MTLCYRIVEFDCINVASIIATFQDWLQCFIILAAFSSLMFNRNTSLLGTLLIKSPICNPTGDVISSESIKW